MPRSNNKGLNVIPPLLPFEIPKRFIDIPDSVIDIVSKYMTVVIGISSPGRDVDIKKIIKNSKMMFRDGIKHNDNLWLQHCAASIREILIFTKDNAFKKAFKNIPDRLSDPDVNRIFIFLEQARVYLSDVVHFCESAKLGNCEKLYPKQGYGQMIKEDFLKNEEVVFERVCIDVIYTLNGIFSAYCLNAS